MPPISPSCRTDFEKVHLGIKNFELWALKILDSSAFLSSGILNGNLNQYGDFDQCLENGNEENSMRTQYCLAHLQLNSKYQKSEELDNVLNLVKSYEAFKSDFDDVGHRIPRFSLINWGICVPASCSPEDIKYSLSTYLKNFTKSMNFDFDVRIQKSMCHNNDPADWNFSFVFVTSFFTFMIFVATMSTFYDLTRGINKSKL
ncbi:nose resistant to fluoxetine protein 6-like [Condylostylus longicornis]|uniref:nose resistant to fluoxetine protein 6-like n=1 Tax=Condylostylus longicornis TaxID=2530218 RepID=UPI00244E1CC4|nr:nose resistant to fluoxetine protein 6-like [Condylostylus longicornis]